MENSRSGGNGNLLLLIVLVVIGYFAFKAGYIQIPSGGDGSNTPQPVTVEPMVVPQKIVTATPQLVQPNYIPTSTPESVWFATAVPTDSTQYDPAALVSVIERTMAEMEACVRAQMADPMNNYHCEYYKEALDQLRDVSIEANK